MNMRTPGRIVCGTSVPLCFLMFLCLVPAEDKQDQPEIQQNAKDGSEMILITGGSFLMGTTQQEIDMQILDAGLPDEWKEHLLDEQPRHRRTIEAFYIYRYEVTNEQYKMFIDATDHRSPPHWNGKDYPAGKRQHPVVEVSWDDAQAYCNWAGTQLPTEAQWEYAARGAEPAKGQPSRVYPWGDKWDSGLANNSSFHAGKDLQNAADWNEWYAGDQKSNYPLTSRGGSFPKSVSPFGVHDMAGNAWEWCADVQAPYPELDANEATDTTARARRGGSWANVALHIRSADRQSASHDNLNLYTGFRCVKSSDR